MPRRKEAVGGTSAARRFVGGAFSGSYRWPPVGVAERRAAVTALPVPVACPPHPRADVAPQRLDELLHSSGDTGLSVPPPAWRRRRARCSFATFASSPDRSETVRMMISGVYVPAEEPVEGVDIIGVGFLHRGSSPSVVVAVSVLWYELVALQTSLAASQLDTCRYLYLCISEPEEKTRQANHRIASIYLIPRLSQFFRGLTSCACCACCALVGMQRYLSKNWETCGNPNSRWQPTKELSGPHIPSSSAVIDLTYRYSNDTRRCPAKLDSGHRAER